MTDIHKHIPEIVQDISGNKYAKVLIELHKCPSCKALAVNLDEPFPLYYELHLRAQVQRAGIGILSHVSIDHGDYICKKCEAEDKALFKCVLCEQDRKSSEIEDSFGLPPEHLCKSCYASVPAKKWDETVERLRREHRYDNE